MLFYLFTIGIILAEPTGSVGLFQPLFPRDFAEGDGGTFYILDTKEHQVRHYSKEVAMINSFGSRGEGPGEFFYPSSIHFLDDVVYIEDATFFTLFDAEGSPMEKNENPLMLTGFPPEKAGSLIKEAKAPVRWRLFGSLRIFKHRRSLIRIRIQRSLVTALIHQEGRFQSPYQRNETD